MSAQAPCPVCGRGDWCLIRRDGLAAICARSASSEPRGDSGFFHDLLDNPVPPPPSSRSLSFRFPSSVLATAVRRYSREDPQLVESFRRWLGVSWVTLHSFGVGWAGRAFSFPMRDAKFNVVGVRFRSESGQKWSLRGSRNGLFLPTDLLSLPVVSDKILLCEGATDAIVLRHAGFAVAGRPNHTAARDMAVELVRSVSQDPVVVADNDPSGDGLRGARKLAAMFSNPAPIIMPRQHKDIRACYNTGVPKVFLQEAVTGRSNKFFQVV